MSKPNAIVSPSRRPSGGRWLCRLLFLKLSASERPSREIQVRGLNHEVAVTMKGVVFYVRSYFFALSIPSI